MLKLAAVHNTKKAHNNPKDPNKIRTRTRPYFDQETRIKEENYDHGYGYYQAQNLVTVQDRGKKYHNKITISKMRTLCNMD